MATSKIINTFFLRAGCTAEPKFPFTTGQAGSRGIFTVRVPEDKGIYSNSMFNSATIQEIKKELEERSFKEVVAYCLTLAKYKKDSKEFLSYLLFESADPSVFSAKVKAEVDEHFSALKKEKNLYFTKKSLRKILRIVTRYSRYAGNNALTAEWLMYFCTKLNESGIPFHNSPVLVNMYQNQVKKIKTLVDGMHEDLRQDYQGDLDALLENFRRRK